MITTNTIFNYCYINKKRWEKYEPIIAKNSYYSYRYAKDVLKGRFILAETIIKKQQKYDILYDMEIIKI
jgi:hypothetical protein